MDRTSSVRIWSDRIFWLLGHVVSSCEGQFLTITDAPRSFTCRNLRKRSRKSWVGRRSFCLDACWQRRILKLNADCLNWFRDRVAGWQLACWLDDFLEICNRHLFGSCHHNDWDCVAAAVYIISLSWPKISGCEATFRELKIWIGDGLASPPLFTNRLDPLSESKLCYLLWETFLLLYCCFAGSPCIFFSSSSYGERKEDSG